MWTETAKKSEMRVMTMESMNKGCVMNRRVDFTINAPVDKIVTVANDVNSFYKIMKKVESAKVVEKLGDICICHIKGGKLSNTDVPREALVACGTKKGEKYTTVVRTSVECDKVGAASGDSVRHFVELSGMVLESTGASSTRVSAMCLVDTAKPLT
jgi:hypothetical protein